MDLGDEAHASVWYSQEDHKLLVINLNDGPFEKVVDLAALGISVAEKISCNKPFSYEGGVIRTMLQKHESAVFEW